MWKKCFKFWLIYSDENYSTFPLIKSPPKISHTHQGLSIWTHIYPIRIFYFFIFLLFNIFILLFIYLFVFSITLVAIMCIVFAFKKGLVSKQCQFFKVCVRDWILSNFFHWKIQIKNHKLNNILVEMGISDLGFFFKGFTFKYYFIQYYLTIIL